MNADISRILKSWEYKSDALIIRKIIGDDEKEKIQIRINLGILQMETEGRPDGTSPYGAESLLEYYNSVIEELIERDGNTENFVLTKDDMREIDKELVQYYHRRICFFALEDYRRARMDAEHNLNLMDIITEHSKDEGYIESHEQYRPFVLMERARAIGLQCINERNYGDAMRHVGSAISDIEKFYREHGASEGEIQRNRELTILRKWRRRIYQDWEGGAGS